MNNPYPICKNCIFADEPLDKDPCKECNRAFLSQRIEPNFVSKRKPKTNADRIRAMTDEEMAQVIYWLRLDALRLEGFEGEIETKEELLDWLKQEDDYG